jgi:EAL domain-containing protein (putative c-di-GMP-specific phosphodiesterase class I)
MGIDCFQGYLHGRPAPIAELPPLPAADRAAS